MTWAALLNCIECLTWSPLHEIGHTGMGWEKLVPKETMLSY